MAAKKRPRKKAAKKKGKRRRKGGMSGGASATTNPPIEIIIEGGVVTDAQQKLQQNIGGMPNRVRWVNKDPIGYALSFGAAADGDWPFTQAPQLILVPPAEEDEGTSRVFTVNQSAAVKAYGYLSDPPLAIPPTGPDVIIE